MDQLTKLQIIGKLKEASVGEFPEFQKAGIEGADRLFEEPIMLPEEPIPRTKGGKFKAKPKKAPRQCSGEDALNLFAMVCKAESLIVAPHLATPSVEDGIEHPVFPVQPTAAVVVEPSSSSSATQSASDEMSAVQSGKKAQKRAMKEFQGKMDNELLKMKKKWLEEEAGSELVPEPKPETSDNQ